MNKRKHKCCMCGETATWYKAKHNKSDTLYYCDKCVPRKSVKNIMNIEDWGEPIANINVMWWDKDCFGKDFLKDGSLERNENSFYYIYLDKDKQRTPSSDFVFNNKGFDKKEKKRKLSQIDILTAYSNNLSLLTKMEAQRIGTDITEILMDKKQYELRQEISYNLFMSKIGDYFTKYKFTIAYKNNFQEFYKRFKYELSKI